MSCIIGTFHGIYRTLFGNYEHHMGIVLGSKLALIAPVAADFDSLF
ncbi:hypothetical protein SDC9_132921 [bioreactor metagenome]|uniref:Uncharacterized protein n=1 Tax=bioreactor metagenome TaxID=1076179 RepID=A0A645D9W7_9ZZZZ